MALIDWDTAEYEETSTDLTPLPEGWYELEIEKTSLTEKDGKKRIAITAVVVQDGYRGRKVFGGFNVVHPSKKAQDISRSQWKQLEAACGLTAPAEDTDEVCGKPVLGKLKIKPAANGYGAGNEVMQWRPIDDNVVEAKPTEKREEPSVAPWGKK